ncbi:9428_t:CDS:2 [Rhizophagus irregularis]|nr:9428_t:CDS:2 [Rhizophagus irregularis]
MGVKATKVTTNSIKRNSDSDVSRNTTDSFFEDTSSSLSSLGALSLYEFTITSNFDTYLYLDGRKFYNISSYILPSDVADVLIEVYEGMKPTIKQIMNVTDSEFDELIHKLSREIKSPLNNYMYITSVRIIAMRNSEPW